MGVTREPELWAVALWVQRNHSEAVESFIFERVQHFDAHGDEGGKRL